MTQLQSNIRYGSKATVAKAIIDEYSRKFEVFLSFRGKDIRANFASHLNTALQNAGIAVFMDDEGIQRGQDITRALPLAIEHSQISIVVFSKNYAESKWCLDELVKIMECCRNMEQVVMPVFYDDGVTASAVRGQLGEFGEAFQRLLDRKNSIGGEDVYSPNQVLTWRAALEDVSHRAGFNVPSYR